MNKIQENRFLIIDDARSKKHYEKTYFRPFGINAEITLVRDLAEAKQHLEVCRQNGYFPETLILDMCAFDFRNPDKEKVDEEWGTKNAAGLVEWYKNNDCSDVFPASVLLNSVDYDISAVSRAGIAKMCVDADPKRKCDVSLVCAAEAGLAANLYIGNPAPKSQVECPTSGFREFLNLRIGTNLPTDKAGVIEYQNKNKIWDIYHLPELVKDKTVPAHDALQYLRSSVLEIAKSGYKQSVELSPYLLNEFGFRFRSHVGEHVKGYAAFSYDDVKRLAEDGKKAVLITDDHRFSFKKFRNDLNGIIFVTDEIKSHDNIMLEAWELNVLSGLPDIRENFASETKANPGFLKDSAGNAITSFLKIADNNGRKELRSYETALNKIARDHIRSCREQGLEAVTDLSVDMNALRYQRIISDGLVTVNPTGHLFRGHFDVSRNNVLSYNDKKLIADVIDITVDEAARNSNLLIEFKANIDSVTRPIGKNTNVGLCRTEHFIRENSDLRRSFRRYVLDGKRDELQNFTDLHKKVMKQFAVNVAKDMTHKDAKVRVRLADAPPAEFFKEGDFDILENKFGDRNIRGVQLATFLPSLYEAQLKGVFESFKPLKGKVRPEILVPTVRTEQELVFVKEMTERVAAGFDFSREEYGFGTMIETKEAVDNVEALVRHCDFVNIGTNDLTSEILDCARDDWNKIDGFRHEKGFNGNPFIEFHPKVKTILINIVAGLYDVKPEAEICVCGNHVEKWNSLHYLNAVGITGISLPPSEKNMQGLKVQYYLNT